MEYTIDYFIRKFSAIPEGKWFVGGWGNDGTHCANGHCGVHPNICCTGTPESRALGRLFEILLLSRLDGERFCNYHWHKVAAVNDAFACEYQQGTAKMRILAALHDIKKLSKEPDAQECDATKPIVVPSAWPNKQSSLTNLIPIVDEVMDVKNVNQNV